MKKIIFFITVLFGVSSILSYSKAEMDTVYSYLKTKWYYHTANGEKITVESLSWKSSGDDYSIIANGKVLPLEEVFDSSGSNLLNPSVKAQVKVAEPKGNEPGNLKGFTEAHNKYRRETGVPDLQWDSRLAAYAQEWADHLKSANNCNMQHRPRSGKYTQKHGENLAWASGKEMDTAEVVENWYSEIKNYNYTKNSCSGVCGHYTQVVWKNSQRVGCAMAKCRNTEIWVCNYDPPGNYIGEKPY